MVLTGVCSICSSVTTLMLAGTSVIGTCNVWRLPDYAFNGALGR